MSKGIDSKILEIQMLQDDLLKELKMYNAELESDSEFYMPNKHKASFNRLRLELNKRYVKLSKIFRGLRKCHI